MPCKDCHKGLKPREKIILNRFEVAKERRAKCDTCDANTAGHCFDLGMPVVELTRDWSTSCPRKQFSSHKQACPGCNRPNQYLSKSSLCQWCEIDRENKAKNAARRGKRSSYIRYDIAQITEIAPVANQSGGNSVVWVYWQGGQRNNELWHSIRLAQQHVTNAGGFIVCGDIPDWYKGESIVSPRVSNAKTQLHFGGVRFKKWLDSIVKLQKIIDDQRVTETFLWMYDDTFIVKPVSIDVLSRPRCSGQLVHGSMDSKAPGLWQEVRRLTAKQLSLAGMPQRNYSTHYPVVYSKEKLQQTIDKFRPDKRPALIESLYLNQWAENPALQGSEFEYVQQVRNGWAPRRQTIVANVGQFNNAARAAIQRLVASEAVS